MMPKSKFMKLFSRCLMRNLPDPGLNGKLIAQEMDMSRMHLHRHLKRYYGQPAGQIITLTRVKIAQKLFLNKPLTVKEVSKKVGFKDPSYFSRVFRNVTDLSPSEFIQIRSENNEGKIT